MNKTLRRFLRNFTLVCLFKIDCFAIKRNLFTKYSRYKKFKPYSKCFRKLLLILSILAFKSMVIYIRTVPKSNLQTFIEKAPPLIRFFNQFPLRITFPIAVSCSTTQLQTKWKIKPFSSKMFSSEDFGQFVEMTSEKKKHNGFFCRIVFFKTFFPFIYQPFIRLKWNLT